MSLEGPGRPVEAVGADGPAEVPGGIRFAFQDAPWPEVLREFASWAELTLDMTDVPEGEFSYFDNRRHSAAEAIDILNGYLLPRGYAVLRRDNFLVVIKTDNANLSTLIPTVEVSELAQRGDNELLRIVVPVKEITATQASEEIAGLLGALGKATPLESNQSVVLQGFGANLRQAVALLGSVAPPATDDKLDFRSFALNHLPAKEAETQIRNLFGLAGGTVNVSGARADIERSMYYRQRSRERGRDERDGRGGGEANPVPLLERVAMNMKVSALARTNSLLVTATPAGLQLVEEVLKSIDVPRDERARAALDETTPVLRVYEIREASEEEVAKTLDVVMPGVVVNEDNRQDTIHILATPPEHREVEALIRTLDSRGNGSLSQLEVIPIRRFSVFGMRDLLERLFETEDDETRPVIQAEPQTSTLVVRGSEEQITQIRSALDAYGEGGDGISIRSSVRTIPARSADAAGVVRMAQELLEPKNSTVRGGGIRIVVPGERRRQQRSAADETSEESELEGVDREHRRPAGDEITGTAISNAQPTDAVEAGRESPFRHSRLVTISETADVTAIEQSGVSNKTEGENHCQDGSQSSDSIPQVRVQIQGDKVLLYSDDLDALDEVEGTIRQLLPTMPAGSEWTVFYLRAAEATETAGRLYQLMPSSYELSNSGQYSLRSYDELGYGAVAQELRIVPEPRTNALFVSGNPAQVQQVEELLELLDTIDLPESFRARVPRAIPVEYADINELATVIRELYKDYLTDPAAQRRNDRERGRGGDEDQRGREDDNSRRERGSSGRGGAQQTGIRMTLAVDERARELLVASDEALFREVEALVRERDRAARENQPVVQVMRVGGNMPAALDEILESYSPRISAEVTEAPQFGGNSNQQRSRSDDWRSRFRRSRD